MVQPQLTLLDEGGEMIEAHEYGGMPANNHKWEDFISNFAWKLDVPQQVLPWSAGESSAVIDGYHELEVPSSLTEHLP